jgi:threonyl-tRNA synthetase
MDLKIVLDEGGGAFYGPKISVQARDAIGRTHQMSTIQLDFQLPQRFAMEYVGADNARHRPIMIHRALFGSVERFFAILLEHYAGALPTWLPNRYASSGCVTTTRSMPTRWPTG